MRNVPSSMGWALVLSVLLHAGGIALVTALAPSAIQVPQRELAALAVRMLAPPAARLPELPSPLPRLMLPQESSPHASAARPAPAAARLLLAPPRGPGVAAVQREASVPGPRGLNGEAARHAFQQMSRALLYPREAIEQGIEGEATVLLFLDESGNAIAARLETSSGYALLDDAAVRAARTLRSLPEGAPREALLPVRFRLR